MSDTPVTPPVKDPSSLLFEQPRVRRTILASYWAVIILAVPLWWSTTSIERLSLPVSRVSTNEDKQLRFPLRVHIDVGQSPDNAHEVAVAVQERFTARKERSLGKLDAVELTLVAGEAVQPSDSDMYRVSISDDISHPLQYERRLAVPSSLTSQTPDIVASLFTPYTSRGSQSFEHIVSKYSPRYRLAFTLLNEDAASGKSVVGWDVQEAVSRHLSPILRQMGVLHNFTVESQVRFYAPLAFQPDLLMVGDETLHGLTQEDLKVFVNSAEWTLASSVSNDPVLHFVLFVPSVSHTPLRILDHELKPTSSNAFILPQWGGIVLLSLPSDSPSSSYLSEAALSSTFNTFRGQLLKLLGVSDLPLGVETNATLPLTDWQLDTLYRQRAVENTAGSKETLGSIVRLVDQISTMPVGHGVRGDIEDSLDALEKAYAVSWNSPTQALGNSAKALTHASRAFFSPGMLALLYFPAEHKYAVYTPLFAPVAVPLVVTALREFSAWSKARRNART
ncbi:hypothetical protein FA95DRAFT_1602095 [Auriscalpium vulgare]|uniref:Uncharacterized protein n=1 Tax=Auriscalpium vulgare TaxID=40419 RepID=A0ACB8S6D7_9AGAM|nr:hypothetical protein FA95DRAFT_1602095 [Auriscalpium vulgare]